MPQIPDETPPIEDWFLPAITAEGSVAQSINAARKQLQMRQRLLDELERALGEDGRPVDRVSYLAQRVRIFENTLRFRLGILRPERPGAWFRTPAATSTGPFSGVLLREPVFAYYDANNSQAVKDALQKCWRRRGLQGSPFGQEDQCLWRSLLELNAEWETICRLDGANPPIRLDRLPERLPPQLASRALRAFLENVSQELKSVRERLDSAYAQLAECCEKFWQHQAAAAARNGAQSSFNPQADEVRAKFRERRRAGGRSYARTNTDQQALEYMGFEDYPSAETLRRRYLDMAKRLHPDIRGGSDDDFKRLTKAYNYLVSRVPA